MIHGYRSAYQTSSPSRSRTPRTPASPARKATGAGGAAARSASNSEATTPTGHAQHTGEQQTRPRSTTAPSTAPAAAESPLSATMPPPQPRPAVGKVGRGDEEGGRGSQQQQQPAAASRPTATELLQVSTAPLPAFLQPTDRALQPAALDSAGSAAAGTTGLLSERSLKVADEQPSSARSDSAALWLSKGRAVSGAGSLSAAATADGRTVSFSQPVSPAKVRGRSLLLQTLPAQLFSPAQPSTAAAQMTATAAAATVSNNSPSAHSSAAAGSPSGSASPGSSSLLSSVTSAAPPVIASSAPPASAAAATLSPDKLNLSPGLTHIIKMRNRRKEADNERRRREEEEAVDEQQSRAEAAAALYDDGQHSSQLAVRTVLSLEELKPRLMALQAERKEADEGSTVTRQRPQAAVECATDGGAAEGEQRDTEQADGEQPRSSAAAAPDGQREQSRAVKASAEDSMSLPVVVGGLLLLGASVYASWVWYQRQRRRLGIRR